MNKTRHYHYKIACYNERIPYTEGQPNITKDDFIFGNNTFTTVLADSEDEAMTKVKDILKRKFYRVVEVFECHESEFDATHNEELKLIQLEQMNKLLKNI